MVDKPVPTPVHDPNTYKNSGLRRVGTRDSGSVYTIVLQYQVTTGSRCYCPWYIVSFSWWASTRLLRNSRDCIVVSDVHWPTVRFKPRFEKEHNQQSHKSTTQLLYELKNGPTAKDCVGLSLSLSIDRDQQALDFEMESEAILSSFSLEI